MRGWMIACGLLLAAVPTLHAGTAPRRVTFTGKVVDTRGQPVGGATVTVNLWDPPRTHRDWDRKPALHATTARADGSFRVQVPVRGEEWKATLVATKEGHGPGGQSVFSAVSPNGWVIALTRPDSVAGRVLDRGGRPVSGARVAALWALGAQLEESLPLEGALPPVVTDARGQFRIAPVPAGSSLSLAVEHPGYAAGTRSGMISSGQEDVTISLPPAGRIVGRVLDAEGRPAANATVYCQRWRSVLAATTDADGRFRFDNLAGSHYSFLAERPQASPEAVTDLAGVLLPEGGEAVCPELRLRPGGVVTGIVKDGQGRPVAGAGIAAERELLMPGRVILRGQGAIATSGADGVYRLRLPPGAWRLSPEKLPAGYLSDLEHDINRQEWPDFLVAEGQTTRANFTLHRAGLLRVQALAAGGRPAGGARVRATHGETVEGLRADTAGRFAVSRLLPGESVRLILFDRDGLEGARLDVTPEPGGGERTVRLQPLPLATGVVVDSAGAPLAEAWVGAEQEVRDGNLLSIHSINRAITDARGRFTLALFPDAQYRLFAGAPGFGMADPRPVEVGLPGARPEPLRFTLARADQFIAGVVVDDGGRPLPGASVMVQRPWGRSSYIAGQTTTDAAGRFRVGSLPPGDVQLSAGLAGYRGVPRQTVAAGTAQARIILAPMPGEASPPAALKVGAPAPPIRVARWIHGPGIRALDEARGKTVVLLFSAAFNPAAKGWNAALKALHARLKEAGREDVLLLALYDASVAAEEATAYVAAEALPFSVGLVEPGRTAGADSPTFRAYGARRLPAVFVIGPDGLLRALDPTPEALPRLIEAKNAM